MIDAAIIGNRIVLADGLRQGAVLIKDGRIEDVLPELPPGDFPVTDAGDNILMPGIIDPHVHINEPGRTEWEGFHTATHAAIAGGITTLVDMPLNSSPVTTTARAFEEKLRSTYNQLHTNCGFWGGIIPGNTHEIAPLIGKGVLGFKAFFTHSGIDEFPNVNEEDLRKAMPLISKAGLPLLVHAELIDDGWPNEGARGASRQSTAESQKTTSNASPAVTRYTSFPDPRSYRAYLASRPRQWEDHAIALMIRLCEEFNCHVHIVHLSSANSIKQIQRAKQRGLPLSVETAQHYLYFNAENIPDGDTAFKCAPPIREKQNNDLLWQALNDGIIDFVATDHSPAPPAMKEIESGDLVKAWGGIASIQFALPVLWTAAKRHGCSVEQVAKWLCENPAALIGKENSKGKIQKGFDADLVIWDDGKKFTVTEDIILHRHKITPYVGESLYGTVEQTWLGGVKVWDSRIASIAQGKIVLAGKE